MFSLKKIKENLKRRQQVQLTSSCSLTNRPAPKSKFWRCSALLSLPRAASSFIHNQKVHTLPLSLCYAALLLSPFPSSDFLLLPCIVPARPWLVLFFPLFFFFSLLLLVLPTTSPICLYLKNRCSFFCVFLIFFCYCFRASVFYLPLHLFHVLVCVSVCVPVSS